MGAGSVQPGKGGLWEILLAEVRSLQKPNRKKVWRQTLLRGSQLRDDRQQLQVEMKQFSLKLCIFFTVRMVKHWDRLPKEAVRILYLEILNFTRQSHKQPSLTELFWSR